MKLLWASPLPPVRSGVSDYAVELLGELERRAEVRVVRPPGWEPPPDWSLGVAMVEESASPAPDELQLVHIGNNPYHEWLLPRLEQPRTVAVLHDAVVHHLLVESTLGRGRPAALRDLLVRAHGDAGRVLARARAVGVTGRRDPFLFPARRAILGRVTGVVVHSRWLARKVERELPRLPVVELPLAVADPGPVDGAALRASLGIPPEALLLAHLGFMTAEKGMLEVLAAVAAARRDGIDLRLLLVGEGAGRGPVDAVIAALGLEDHVSLTGFVPMETLRQLPGAADLGVVLRVPSAGETSAAVLRFLAAGTPVAVTALHQFLEWPEQAAPRLTPGPAATAELVRVIREAGIGRGWEARRRAARQTYLAAHRPADVAERLLTALLPLVA